MGWGRCGADARRGNARVGRGGEGRMCAGR